MNVLSLVALLHLLAVSMAARPEDDIQQLVDDIHEIDELNMLLDNQREVDDDGDEDSQDPTQDKCKPAAGSVGSFAAGDGNSANGEIGLPDKYADNQACYRACQKKRKEENLSINGATFGLGSESGKCWCERVMTGRLARDGKFESAFLEDIDPTMKVKKFEYKLSEMKFINSKPETMGMTVVENICKKELHHRCPDQKKTLEVSKTTTSTKTFTNTAGVSVTVGTRFKVGVPLAQSEVSVDVSASYEHEWGKEETEEKTWTTQDECTASAGMKVTCEFQVKKKEITVPFKILWCNGESTTGLYKGVDFFSGGMKVSHEALNRKRSVSGASE